jgi:hypothetical protein
VKIDKRWSDDKNPRRARGSAMTTAVDLFQLALKDLGALGIGQAISAEDTADALATAEHDARFVVG